MGCGCGKTTNTDGYQLFTPDGVPLVDDRGATVVFATRAEAEAARARNGGVVVLAGAPTGPESD